MENKFSVSEFVAYCNQTLEYAYSGCVIEGEVSEYKESQGKWVFFSLKDEESSVQCFMPIWNLRIPIEDGMKIIVRGTPKLTKWGKFSITITQIQPVGKGNIKKSFELLKAKLTKEGLFNPAKKRPIPNNLTKIGVISSTQAAGYADFIKIINERWGGLKITVCHTQVQGLSAPDQIIRALNYLNERGEVEVIAIIRGGGSADDLACFNDEKLVRAIASSKIPVITGIGHEVDESLSDLAADKVASTPSNAAQFLTRDKKAEVKRLKDSADFCRDYVKNLIGSQIENLSSILDGIKHEILTKISDTEKEIDQKLKLLEALNPERFLDRGYAILSGEVKLGGEIKITTKSQKIRAKVIEIENKE